MGSTTKAVKPPKAANPLDVLAQVENDAPKATPSSRTRKPSPTFASLLARVGEIRAAAKALRRSFPNARDAKQTGAWTYNQFVQGIDVYEAALQKVVDIADALKPGTQTGDAARAVRRYSQPLYFRGRIDLATGKLGLYATAKGTKGVDWDATALSKAADGAASAPLAKIASESNKQRS